MSLNRKGDYHRYLAEFAVGDKRKTSADKSLEAYKAATEVAASSLAPTHPNRRGLALNISGVYNEILNSPDQACQLAKQAFDDAIAGRCKMRTSSKTKLIATQSSTPCLRRATRTLPSSCSSSGTTWYVFSRRLDKRTRANSLQTLWTSSEAEPSGDAPAAEPATDAPKAESSEAPAEPKA